VYFLYHNGTNACYNKENHSMPKSEVAGISVASVFGAIITAAILLGLCLATLYYLSRQLNRTSAASATASTTTSLLSIEGDAIINSDCTEIEKNNPELKTHYGTASLSKP